MLVILLFLRAVIGPFHNPADMILAYEDLLAENEAPFKAKSLDINALTQVMSELKEKAPKMKPPYGIEACVNQAQCEFFVKSKLCEPGDLAQYSYNDPLPGWSVYCLGFERSKTDPPPDKG